MTWTEMMLIACAEAKCTLLQGRRAWKAATDIWGLQEGKLHKWNIAGLGTLEIRGGSEMPPLIESAPGVEPTRYIIFVASCTQGNCFGDPEITAYINHRLYNNDMGWLDLFNTPDQITAGTGQPYPQGIYFVAPLGWAPGDPSPYDEGGGSGVKKIRMKTHKGVIARHREGDI